MPSTPMPNEPGFRFSSPLVVNIGIGALHRIPQPGESRMEEAKPAHADIGTVAFEDADAVDVLGVGLPLIQNDEADAVSSAHQFLAKEDLLPFGSSDMGHMRALRKLRIGIRSHEADRSTV